MGLKPAWGRSILAMLIALVFLSPAPAKSQTQERIRSYEIDIQIEKSGSLLVEESIDYDFGPEKRRGIFRDIPVRLRYNDRYDRIYPLEILSVKGSPGTPDEYELEDAGSKQRIKIGDPDRTISGRHRYSITYRVENALNSFPEHDELYWNAIGADWAVPIEKASALVSAPGEITRAACFAGPTGSNLTCAGPANPTGAQARFEQTNLSPYEALTVVVAIPKGTVPLPRPVLEERWSFTRAFSLTPFTVGASVLLLVAIVLGLSRLAWKAGRDRRWSGSAVDAAFGAPGASETSVPLFDGDVIPVEFEPPEGVRPGQIGTLIDERAGPLDVTATIVDLAVRGFLRINEIPKEGWFGKPDWNLEKLGKEAKGLRAYEAKLLNGLFEDGNEVKLSALRNKFAVHLRAVENALYDDAVQEGWFTARPDRIRTRWRVIGVVALVASGGIVFVAARFTHLGVIPIPLVIGAILVIAGAGKMPRRTEKGTATLRRSQGFRRFIEESEVERARFAERENLFSEYLPYAIVFGATKKWAKRFEGIDGQLPATGWYGGIHPFTVGSFSETMDGFAVTTSGTIASTPSGSGASGFSGGGSSGGGGGGGGGGSW